MRSRNHEIKKPWDRKTIRSRNHEIKKPWDQETMRSRNHEVEKKLDRETMRSINHEIKKPWDRETMRSRNHDMKIRNPTIPYILYSSKLPHLENVFLLFFRNFNFLIPIFVTWVCGNNSDP